MGAECAACGHDVYDECAWCALVAERDALRDRIERALSALRAPDATNWERRQAAGLILTEGQED